MADFEEKFAFDTVVFVFGAGAGFSGLGAGFSRLDEWAGLGAVIGKNVRQLDMP